MTTQRHRIKIADRAMRERLLTPAAFELAERDGVEISIELTADADLETKARVLLEALAPAPAAFVRLQQLAAIGELAAGVSHETRNVLTAIIGFSQLARQHGGDGEGARRHVERIEREAHRAVEILERLLSLGRVNHDELELVRVDHVIADMVSATVLQASVRRLRIVTSVPGELPRVRCRRGELAQVVLNLIINAIHATPEDGEIRVSATVHRDMLEVIVRDTGSGVPAELRQRIFEPFFTTKATGEGTGLGLALCRSFVTAAGGTIAYTDGDGGGAAFVVRLPVEAAA